MLHFSLFMEALDTTTRDAVLAIDDEPELLEIVRGCLEPAGFQVHTASSPKQGVDFYEKNWRHIKLVLLDFLMPEMMGDLVFECLKRQNPDVRIILLTGCEDNVAQRMFQEGLFGYIHKPFDFQDFIQRVHEAVDTI
jgi:two-component system cell cycle sensor histidine kinase/response regulator CckA